MIYWSQASINIREICCKNPTENICGLLASTAYTHSSIIFQTLSQFTAKIKQLYLIPY